MEAVLLRGQVGIEETNPVIDSLTRLWVGSDLVCHELFKESGDLRT